MATNVENKIKNLISTKEATFLRVKDKLSDSLAIGMISEISFWKHFDSIRRDEGGSFYKQTSVNGLDFANILLFEEIIIEDGIKQTDIDFVVPHLNMPNTLFMVELKINSTGNPERIRGQLSRGRTQQKTNKDVIKNWAAPHFPGKELIFVTIVYDVVNGDTYIQSVK